MTDWTIEARDWHDVDGAGLRAAQRAELDARYGGDDHEPGAAPSATDIDLFLVATDNATGDATDNATDNATGDATGDAAGGAVGCGALRRLDATTAEVKRMYVVPAARGSGVATAILRALEEAALARGWTTLRLETGTEQPDAQRFYEREGYHPIPLFGVYAGSTLSVCYERALRR